MIQASLFDCTQENRAPGLTMQIMPEAEQMRMTWGSREDSSRGKRWIVFGSRGQPELAIMYLYGAVPGGRLGVPTLNQIFVSQDYKQAWDAMVEAIRGFANRLTGRAYLPGQQCATVAWCEETRTVLRYADARVVVPEPNEDNSASKSMTEAQVRAA